MHHQHAETKEFLQQICDVISADYDVNPSCRFSHGTVHMVKLNAAFCIDN